MTIKPKYLTDESGKKIAVQLDMKTFNKLIEALDELDCIAAYDEAKKEEPNYLPIDEAFEEIEKLRQRKNSNKRKSA
ncbi:MAG: hypothetical protein HGB19_01245 [Chlorobiales bacterium]|jgi:hypothetical protein|nr:hypothetical protein [Chlorobiales bacterium]